jgi:metal-sulfur cluster biosynthetic enzyme
MVNLTQAQAWQALQQVPDPELPAVSICELGIVRELRTDADAVTVVVTPTYSGCPATELIVDDIRSALRFDPYHPPVRIRLHRLQGVVPLRQLPGAV